MDLAAIAAAVVILFLVWLSKRRPSYEERHSGQQGPENSPYDGKLWIRTKEGASQVVTEQIRTLLGLRLLEVSCISNNLIAVLKSYPNWDVLKRTIEQIEQLPDVEVVQTHDITPRYDYTRDENRKVVHGEEV